MMLDLSRALDAPGPLALRTASPDGRFGPFSPGHPRSVLQARADWARQHLRRATAKAMDAYLVRHVGLGRVGLQRARNEARCLHRQAKDWRTELRAVERLLRGGAA